jgi:hypothetical protein
MWGNGVDFSRKAERMPITRDEVGARNWSQVTWKKGECKNSGKQAIHHFWITPPPPPPPPELKEWPWAKKTSQDRLKGLAATFFDEGVQKLVPRYGRCLNLLKPSGNYIRPGLTLKNSTWCPHCVYVFCTDLRTNSDFCVTNIKRLAFITEVESVYSAVRAQSLYKTDTLRL